jgi:small subunit ribosomal protein S5
MAEKTYQASFDPKGQEGSEEEDKLIEKVVYITRVAKVVKGGRRFHFSAIVVKGDGEGSVGVGIGKANEVPEAMRKASERAEKNMVKVSIVKGTIPHPLFIKFGAARVVLRPAGPGTGIIAGGPVRAVLEAAGVENILTKIIGTTNPYNVVKATMKALTSLVSTEDMATKRGKAVAEIRGR